MDIHIKENSRNCTIVLFCDSSPVGSISLTFSGLTHILVDNMEIIGEPVQQDVGTLLLTAANKYAQENGLIILVRCPKVQAIRDAEDKAPSLDQKLITAA